MNPRLGFLLGLLLVVAGSGASYLAYQARSSADMATQSKAPTNFQELTETDPLYASVYNEPALRRLWKVPVEEGVVYDLWDGIEGNYDEKNQNGHFVATIDTDLPPVCDNCPRVGIGSGNTTGEWFGSRTRVSVNVPGKNYYSIRYLAMRDHDVYPWDYFLETNGASTGWQYYRGAKQNESNNIVQQKRMTEVGDRYTDGSFENYVASNNTMTGQLTPLRTEYLVGEDVSFSMRIDMPRFLYSPTNPPEIGMLIYGSRKPLNGEGVPEDAVKVDCIFEKQIPCMGERRGWRFPEKLSISENLLKYWGGPGKIINDLNHGVQLLSENPRIDPCCTSVNHDVSPYNGQFKFRLPVEAIDEYRLQIIAPFSTTNTYRLHGQWVPWYSNPIKIGPKPRLEGTIVSPDGKTRTITPEAQERVSLGERVTLREVVENNTGQTFKARLHLTLPPELDVAYDTSASGGNIRLPNGSVVRTVTLAAGTSETIEVNFTVGCSEIATPSSPQNCLEPDSTVLPTPKVFVVKSNGVEIEVNGTQGSLLVAADDLKIIPEGNVDAAEEQLQLKLPAELLDEGEAEPSASRTPSLLEQKLAGVLNYLEPAKARADASSMTAIRETIYPGAEKRYVLEYRASSSGIGTVIATLPVGQFYDLVPTDGGPTREGRQLIWKNVSLTENQLTKLPFSLKFSKDEAKFPGDTSIFRIEITAKRTDGTQEQTAKYQALILRLAEPKTELTKVYTLDLATFKEYPAPTLFPGKFGRYKLTYKNPLPLDEVDLALTDGKFLTIYSRLSKQAMPFLGQADNMPKIEQKYEASYDEKRHALVWKVPLKDITKDELTFEYFTVLEKEIDVTVDEIGTQGIVVEESAPYKKIAKLTTNELWDWTYITVMSPASGGLESRPIPGVSIKQIDSQGQFLDMERASEDIIEDIGGKYYRGEGEYSAALMRLMDEHFFTEFSLGGSFARGRAQENKELSWALSNDDGVVALKFNRKKRIDQDPHFLFRLSNHWDEGLGTLSLNHVFEEGEDKDKATGSNVVFEGGIRSDQRSTPDRPALWRVDGASVWPHTGYNGRDNDFSFGQKADLRPHFLLAAQLAPEAHQQRQIVEKNWHQPSFAHKQLTVAVHSSPFSVPALGLVNPTDPEDIHIASDWARNYPLSQRNTLAHELGHWIQHNLQSLSSQGEAHGGYASPSSARGFTEGFADFISAAVRAELGSSQLTQLDDASSQPNFYHRWVVPLFAPYDQPDPRISNSFGDRYNSIVEEYVIASLLLDLAYLEPIVAKQQSIRWIAATTPQQKEFELENFVACTGRHLSMSELFDLLRKNEPEHLQSLYTSLKKTYGGSKAGDCIDQEFALRGIFNDAEAPFWKFNLKPDSGFVPHEDLGSSGNGAWFEADAGKVWIGPRISPARFSSPPLPDSHRIQLEFSDKEEHTIHVTVQGEDLNLMPPLEYTTKVKSGTKIPIMIPDFSNEAYAVIRAEGSSDSFVVTGERLNEFLLNTSVPGDGSLLASAARVTFSIKDGVMLSTVQEAITKYLTENPVEPTPATEESPPPEVPPVPYQPVDEPTGTAPDGIELPTGTVTPIDETGSLISLLTQLAAAPTVADAKRLLRELMTDANTTYTTTLSQAKADQKAALAVAAGDKTAIQVSRQAYRLRSKIAYRTKTSTIMQARQTYLLRLKQLRN